MGSIRNGSAAAFVSLALLTPWAKAADDTTAPTAATHTILIKGFKFVPDKLTVNAGDTVIWKNEDIVPHTASGDDLESNELDAGESWIYKTQKKGSFPYFCRFHPGMAAELIVQ